MPSEQSLLPVVYFRNPLIKREQSWYATERCNPEEEDNQLPRGDTKLRAIESLEVQPCTDIDEASTVKHEVDHRSERFCLGLPVESAVPRHCRACKIRRDQFKLPPRVPLRTCGKCSKKIVHPQATRDSYREHGQGEILSHERFAIRQASVMREIQELAESVSYRTVRNLALSNTQVLTHYGAEQSAQDNLVCKRESAWNEPSRDRKTYRAIR